jgi:hypothetical protein
LDSSWQNTNLRLFIALVKEHFEHIKVEKLKDSYKNELQKIQSQIDMAEQTIGSQVRLHVIFTFQSVFLNIFY